MEVDHIKLMNTVLEKTNLKLNALQSQVIVLESQLQLAIELNKQLQDQIDKAKKKDTKTAE